MSEEIPTPIKRVLVIEESAILKKVASHILTLLGMEPILTASREEAIKICFENMPDCIMVDGLMAENGTIDIIKEIRALPKGDFPKIIAMPLEYDLHKVTKLLRQGANDILLRPFNIHHMRDKLAKLNMV